MMMPSLRCMSLDLALSQQVAFPPLVEAKRTSAGAPNSRDL
jgi:hypothetical protein